MVGIKGRSKACRTCLRRKKGCGKQRPSCEQCLRAGILCGGYRSDLIFINSNSPPSQTSAYNAAVDKERTALIQKRLNASATASHTHDLARTAQELKICAQFWDLYLPNRRQLPLDLTRNALGGWINSVQDLHTTHPVLRKSLLALSLVTVGRQVGEKRMQLEGERLYGETLGQLSQALATMSKGGPREEALFASIRLFGMYEMLHGEEDDMLPSDMFGAVAHQRKSWQAHCFGDFSFVGAHPPEYFAEGHSHELFVEGRFTYAVLTLRSRQRSFLTTKPWMTAPWSVHKKTPRDLVVDIVLETAGLFQDLDRSKAYPHKEQLIIQSHLVDRAIVFQKRLLAWHDAYAATPCFATCEEEVPSSVKAVDLAVAHIMSVYWSACLTVTHLRDGLLPSLTGIRRPEEPLMNTDDLCRQLVNVIPICLHPDAGIFRATIITFSLSLATLHFSIIPETEMVKERKWLMENLQKPVCLPITQFISSLGYVGSNLFRPMIDAPWDLVPAVDGAAEPAPESREVKHATLGGGDFYCSVSPVY